MAKIYGRLVVDKLDEVYLSVSTEDSIRKELSEFFKFKVPGAEFIPAVRKRFWDGYIRLFNLQKDKWLWYTGKLSQEEIQEKNWDYDPFNGLTILKSDYDKFFGADRDIQKAIEKMEYCKVVVEYLQDIVSQLTWRHQTIKNIIEWRKFMAGS